MVEPEPRFFKKGRFEGHISTPVLIPTDKYNGRRRIYQLEYDFTYLLIFEGGTQTIFIPAGFETDLATIPVALQILLGNRDSYAEEAIVHDFCCDNDMPRFWTNAQMRSLMCILHRPYLKRLAIFYGLMFFGYKSPIMNFFTKIKNFKIEGINGRNSC